MKYTLRKLAELDESLEVEAKSLFISSSCPKIVWLGGNNAGSITITFEDFVKVEYMEGGNIRIVEK